MTELSTTQQQDLAARTAATRKVAAVANDAAARHTFKDYTERKSENTVAAQRTDLHTFSTYLAQVGIDLDGETLQTVPHAWEGMTFGIVEGFVRWMLHEGYSIASANRKLSTVKTYCKLATKAQVIPESDYRLIRTVTGYSRKEGQRIDAERQKADTPTRTGHKAAEPVRIGRAQARQLKALADDSDQAVRDAVLMSLLLDLGLRVSELCDLTVDNVDLKEGTVTFYRSKVDKQQTHELKGDSLAALQLYFDRGLAPAAGSLMRGSRKSGRLSDAGLTRQSATARVRTLGERVGIEGLSAHDCRHYWATTAAREGTDAFALRDAGGWTSMAMPSRYVESAAVANERVKLGR